MTEYGKILLCAAALAALLLACGCTESAEPIPATRVTPERPTTLPTTPAAPTTGTPAPPTAAATATTTTTAPAPTKTTAPTTAGTTAIPTTTATTVTTTAVPGKNIRETLSADARFTTFVTALGASRVDGMLAGEGPFTVFAPTNEAFDKLPAGTLDTLLVEPRGELKMILLYHVVPQKLPAADLSKLSTVTTLLESDLEISTTDGLTVDGARVISADIQCSNGVIHAIDTFMMPPM